jgi:putative CocE/NonD family hydrolase
VIRRIAVLAALLGLLAALPSLPSATADDTVRVTGYLPTRDGTLLHYTYVRPAGPGPFPTLLEYSGYDPGNTPDADYIARFVPKGYAFIGVNLRGSGCSGGVWDFFQPKEAEDGYDAVEWIAAQPWSNGRVGMIGKSYPGITQLFVAEQQPPHLVAIAPGHSYGDIYRDIAYPGGVFNYSFAALWSFVAQPRYSYDPPLTTGVAGNDPVCVANQQGRAEAQPHNPFVQALQHPWDDALHHERSPVYAIDKVRVPTWTVLAWQDEQVGPRSTSWVSKFPADVPLWGIVSNGDHSMYRTGPALADLAAFIDRYVKGEDNGFEVGRPKLKVWWEAGRNGGARAPGFVTGTESWPPTGSHVERLYLGAGGALGADLSTGSDSYAYAPETGQGIPNARYGDPSLPNRYFWDRGPVPGAHVAYTSPALDADTPVLGTASADLWLSSTAVDTDLQVTLTEVRPDGQETFVQQGWLRASHRALDAAESTETSPVPTHQQADQQLLTPGAPVLARVEVFPFGHLFRAGSKLRLYVEAPKSVPDLWGFAALPVPAVNTVLHDAAHPSSLALPVLDSLVTLDGSDVPAALPDCNVIRQPCRAVSSFGS